MSFYITNDCTYCGICAFECPINAIETEDLFYYINQSICDECNGDDVICIDVCPEYCILENKF